jgi:hypothetical protein
MKNRILLISNVKPSNLQPFIPTFALGKNQTFMFLKNFEMNRNYSFDIEMLCFCFDIVEITSNYEQKQRGH